MPGTLAIIVANQYNSSAINSTFTKFIEVQFWCKFNYMFLNEVIVKDGVVLDYIIPRGVFKFLSSPFK